MSKSIMQEEKSCYACGLTIGLHRHHIFYGTSNRKQSEKYGCWVYLCPYHHTLSNHAVHVDRAFDLRLKEECQSILIENGWSEEEFIKTFGKNYLS